MGAGAQPLFVHRQGQQIARVAGEDVAGVRVAGVFHADHGVLVDQQVGQQVERMLRAHRDDDFLGVGPDAAAGQHLGADLLDQCGVVVGDQVRRPAADVQHRQRLDAAFAPFRGGEQVLVELGVDKGIGLLLPVARLGDVALPGRAEAQPFVPAHVRLAAVGGRGVGSRTGMAAHDRVADEVAAAFARHQITLAHQLLVGEHDGVARDAQLVGQMPAGRHRRARRQVAAEDGGHQHLAHAALQAEVGRAFAFEQALPQHRLEHRGLAGHDGSLSRPRSR